MQDFGYATSSESAHLSQYPEAPEASQSIEHHDPSDPNAAPPALCPTQAAPVTETEGEYKGLVFTYDHQKGLLYSGYQFIMYLDRDEPKQRIRNAEVTYTFTSRGTLANQPQYWQAHNALQGYTVHGDVKVLRQRLQKVKMRQSPRPIRDLELEFKRKYVAQIEDAARPMRRVKFEY